VIVKGLVVNGSGSSGELMGMQFVAGYWIGLGEEIMLEMLGVEGE